MESSCRFCAPESGNERQQPKKDGMQTPPLPLTTTWLDLDAYRTFEETTQSPPSFTLMHA